jgi:hypothetical protein
VVLVPIIAAVGQDQVRFWSTLEILEPILDRSSLEKKVAIAPRTDDDLAVRDALDDSGGAGPGFLSPRSGPAAHNPPDAGYQAIGYQPQNRASAADLDVVGVGADRQDAEAFAGVGKRQMPHERAYRAVVGGTASSPTGRQTAHGGLPAS